MVGRREGGGIRMGINKDLLDLELIVNTAAYGPVITWTKQRLRRFVLKG